MKKLFTLALAALSLTVCAKQPKDMYETDEFQTQSGKTVRFHALVHSSVRIEFDGKEIEVDQCGKLGDRTIDYSAFPKADYIIVTHEHYDHLDKAAIKQLSKEGTTAEQKRAVKCGFMCETKKK